jgi:repressor LexA
MAAKRGNKLTARQREVFDWIRGFITEHDMPPTVREIGRGFGMQSSSVFDHPQALERKGYLRRGEMGARSLILEKEQPRPCSHPEVPVLGRIAAGSPIEAVEDDLGSIPVNPELLTGAEGFALRVEGESMVDAGIRDGDYVIARRQDTARDGDIVVALIEGEATLKRFYRDGDGVRLEAANGNMSPIRIGEGDFRIHGRVVAVHRILKE